MLRDITDWDRAEPSSGSKDGFWVLEPRTGRRGLVKRPRFRKSRNFYEGEAWSEVLSCRLGRALGLDLPDVDPVLLDDVVCPLSWNCVPQGWELREGVTLAGIDKEKEGLSFQDIRELLTVYIGESAATSGIIRLACFDILTGNTDRHWQNWGVLLPPGVLQEDPRMAPFYDNGSGFASNWAPDRFERYLDDECVRDRFDSGFQYEIRLERNGTKPRLSEILSFLSGWDPDLAGMKAALVPLESTKITEMIRNIEKDVGNDTIRQFSGILLERRRQVLMKGAVENG